MRRVCVLFVVVSTLFMAGRARAIPSSPAPGATPGVGATFTTAVPAGSFPGDPDGALGRTYLALKANDEVEFIERNADGTLNTSQIKSESDDSFWGTSVDGLTVVQTRGDGRIYYDPYGPNDPNCEPCGRWLFVELATFSVNGTDVGGILFAVSNGGPPTLSSSWVKYALYDASAPACTPSTEQCEGDQPRLGFNGSWIAVLADDMTNTSKGDPELFVYSRHDAECGETVQPLMHSTDPSLATACVATTYDSNGVETDPSNLYIVRNYDESQGQIGIEEISNGSNGPALNNIPIYTPSVGTTNSWNFHIPDLDQKDAKNNPITPGPNDDRFTGCVVRNHAI